MKLSPILCASLVSLSAIAMTGAAAFAAGSSGTTMTGSSVSPPDRIDPYKNFSTNGPNCNTEQQQGRVQLDSISNSQSTHCNTVRSVHTHDLTPRGERQGMMSPH